MSRLHYWCMRLIRRSIPQAAVEWMLDRGVLLKPGLDTRAPRESVEQLQESCNRLGMPLAGQVVCVVGYGGSFGIALALLDAGVRHVVLQDPFAPLRQARIRQIDRRRLEQYFHHCDGEWHPDPQRITIVREFLDVYVRNHPASADIVFSSSVLEHVDDVERLVGACRELTRPGGVNVHAVDLRDHYFRYPFEMLCYERSTWKRWLDSCGLNRLRFADYQTTFTRHFPEHRLIVTQALPEEFQQAKTRIRAEFLTGDDEIDGVGTIRVEARRAA